MTYNHGTKFNTTRTLLSNYGISRFIKELLPNGRLEGNDWVALNPTRDDKNAGSFRININNGRWIDFATNDYGRDCTSLYAYVKGLAQGEAAEELIAKLNGGKL